MTTISTDRDLLTLINVMDVDPAHCDEVVALFAETTAKVISGVDGFVSSNVHRSLDGTRVINYAQWASEEALDAVHENPDLEPYVERIDALVISSTPILTTVAHVTEG